MSGKECQVKCFGMFQKNVCFCSFQKTERKGENVWPNAN